MRSSILGLNTTPAPTCNGLPDVTVLTTRIFSHWTRADTSPSLWARLAQLRKAWPVQRACAYTRPVHAPTRLA
jgi:hypothetical protein